MAADRPDQLPFERVRLELGVKAPNVTGHYRRRSRFTRRRPEVPHQLGAAEHVAGTSAHEREQLELLRRQIDLEVIVFDGMRLQVDLERPESQDVRHSLDRLVHGADVRASSTRSAAEAGDVDAAPTSAAPTASSDWDDRRRRISACSSAARRRRSSNVPACSARIDSRSTSSAVKIRGLLSSTHNVPSGNPSDYGSACRRRRGCSARRWRAGCSRTDRPMICRQ